MGADEARASVERLAFDDADGTLVGLDPDAGRATYHWLSRATRRQPSARVETNELGINGFDTTAR